MNSKSLVFLYVYILKREDDNIYLDHREKNRKIRVLKSTLLRSFSTMPLHLHISQYVCMSLCSNSFKIHNFYMKPSPEPSWANSSPGHVRAQYFHSYRHFLFWGEVNCPFHGKGKICRLTCALLKSLVFQT